MAGQTYTVNIGDDDLLPPWTTVFDVAEAIDVDEWALVGGLMVQLHARRASIPPPDSCEFSPQMRLAMCSWRSLSRTVNSAICVPNIRYATPTTCCNRWLLRLPVRLR